MLAIELENNIKDEIALLNGNEEALHKVLSSIKRIARNLSAASEKEMEKKEILDALKQVKGIREGKIKTRLVEDFLNEL